jgi:AmmeMemoRadiSam system protein B/AmmeMemoRadiSam system protein A
LEFGDLFPFFFLAQVETDKERRQDAGDNEDSFNKVLHQKPSGLILSKAGYLSNRPSSGKDVAFAAFPAYILNGMKSGCRRKTEAFLLGAAILAAAASGQGLRKASFAGPFYEADPVRLGALIERLLDAAPEPPASAPAIRALIVPHAGYAYSAATAAAGYRWVRGRDYSTVVVIGPSHHLAFEGCSIWPDGGFETPLGIAPVDREFARKLAQASGFRFIPEAFDDEHALEVQIPFIQKVLPRARIVPVVMGRPSKSTIADLASALEKAARGQSVLVVASSDMSHFLPKEEANRTDRETIALLVAFKTEALLRKVVGSENILCGGGPVLAALDYARRSGPAEVTFLKYADSAEASGPPDRVVGYMSAVLQARAPEENFTLGPDGKKELLRISREAVTAAVRGKAAPVVESSVAGLAEDRGVFVTLTRSGRLRGCIGYIEPILPLAEAVARCAAAAAIRDPRFDPISPAELQDIEIEISVLTPPLRISDPAKVRVGKHGLILSRGGVLLPQVAVENHWSREEFLAQACLKAGLPEDAWKKGADIFIFEAIVFR